jgi:hypothetical protein
MRCKFISAKKALDTKMRRMPNRSRFLKAEEDCSGTSVHGDQGLVDSPYSVSAAQSFRCIYGGGVEIRKRNGSAG